MAEPEEPLPPPNLVAAASMIRNYGEDHGLTPQALIDVFHDGLVAKARRLDRPAWLGAVVIVGN